KAYHDAVVDEERVLKGRVSKSRIEVVKDDDGNTFDGEDIALQFVDHFKSFLGAEEDVFPIEDCNRLFVKKLDPIIATSMIRPILDEEIRDAMFGIKDDKVAGPDGFTSKFFKKAWSIIGPDVCRAVKEFFTSGKLLSELNANLISLVPKLKIPIRLSDYRPIACCNVVYKCINRLAIIFIDSGIDVWVRIDKRFQYHYGCKNLDLTYLCFADDLLLLCHRDPISACIIRRGLDEFSMSSGLYPSLEKSTSFFSNIPSEIKEQIALALPFKEGALLVRYLGVPMMTKKLCNIDCRLLIDNVRKRIFYWKNKYLSYAGKLQLIAYVLSSLNVYWASMFINSNHDKIVDWIDNGRWSWPNDWIRRFREVLDVPVPVLNELDDKAIWYNKKNEGRIKVMAKLNNLSNVWAEVISGERNIKLFENKFRTVDVVFNIIVNTIRLKLLSLNVKWTRDVSIAANIWGLPRLGLKGTYGLIDDMDIDDSDL
ncbi:hypothetical protein Tco_0299433, partial [Tanacetum coccineum]